MGPVVRNVSRTELVYGWNAMDGSRRKNRLAKPARVQGTKEPDTRGLGRSGKHDMEQANQEKPGQKKKPQRVYVLSRVYSAKDNLSNQEKRVG